MRGEGSFTSALATAAAIGSLVAGVLAATRVVHGSPSTIAAAALVGAPTLPESRPLEPVPAEAASPAESPEDPLPTVAARRVLHLELLATKDRIDVAPFELDGAPREEEMAELAWVFAPAALRVAGKERVTPDPRLVDLLMRISSQLGDKPLILVSGHRRPGRGTGSRSYHVRGMAADIAVSGVKPMDLRKAAIAAGALGVGLYPAFVHVDVRDEPYRWSSGAGPRHL